MAPTIVLAVGVSCPDIYQAGAQGAERPLSGRPDLYAARVGASVPSLLRRVLVIESAT